MLRVSQFDTNNLEEVTVESMDFNKLKWLDCENPSKEELQKIKNLINIPSVELERCVDEDERPSITELENFSMLIFKSPLMENEEISASSFSILISENLLITIRKRAVNGVEKIWDLEYENKKKFFKKGSTYLTYQILEKVMDDYFSILDHVEKDIDKLENIVFHNPEKKIVKKIFSLKKTLIFFHKALSANREVLFNIENELTEKIPTSQIKNFRYVYQDTTQLIDMVATYRDILTGALDIYLSSMSHNLNKIMKKMAAFGSLVLVPTFITGLYGMNFKFMPEIGWEKGYLFAWLLIISSILFLYNYFRKNEWF